MEKLNNRKTQTLALVLALLSAFAAPSVTMAAAKKAASGTKKAPARSSAHTARTSTANKNTIVKKTTRRGTSTAARRTPSGPPRQSSPSAERYKEIQQALVERGYTDGTPDGVWNSQWVDALRRFQTDQNIEADGKLGALSIIALGLGPKRQALQLPPPGSASGPGSQQLFARPDSQISQ